MSKAGGKGNQLLEIVENWRKNKIHDADWLPHCMEVDNDDSAEHIEQDEDA